MGRKGLSVMCLAADACLAADPRAASLTLARPRGSKTFFMLNSAEHEIYLAHKC